MSDVLVFDYQEPLERLTAWLLTDSGIPNVRVTTRDDLKDMAAAQHPKVVVVNSTASLEEISEVVAEVHAYDGNPRTIVLHAGRGAHMAPARTEVDLHDVSDPDRLIQTVRSVLGGETPPGDAPRAPGADEDV
jgi:hypothetical protein